MTEIDRVWYCRGCDRFLLEEETISDSFPDLIPFCSQCQERLEGVHEGDLLRGWRMTEQQLKTLLETLDQYLRALSA